VRTVKNGRRFLQRHREEDVFFEVEMNLINFSASNLPSAKTAYPFTMVLPHDLAQSETLTSTKIRACQGRIRYMLVAMLH
jgi:hypothetical protein